MKVSSFAARFAQTLVLFVLAVAGTEARAVILPCQPTFPPLAQLAGVFISASAVGDYDNDGDLDLLLSGRTGAGESITRLYRNSGSGSFVDAGVTLPQVESGALAWGDFNNDGWLDFALTGIDAQTNAHAQVFRNNGNGTFTDLGAGLTGVFFSTASWADYNNDGYLDLLITGLNPISGAAVTKLYRNAGGTGFVDVPSNLEGVTDGSAAWADFDNDGDLDLLLTGLDGTMDPFTRLYENQGGTNFINASAGLPAVFLGSAAWGDHDNDGRLDILLTGFDENFDYRGQIFRNLGGGSFADALAGLPGVAFSAAAWGDYDNDGYLDLALAGEDVSFAPISRIYHNNGGTNFTDTGVMLPGAALGTLAFGDFNGDGALDLLLGGDDYASNILTHVYRSDCADTNTPPSEPGNLQVAVSGSSATFTWSASADDHTPAAGLSYNLVVGTSLNGVDANSPMAAVPGGFRRVVRLGAQGESLSWTLNDLPSGTLSWSVQAIDTVFAGGAFAAPASFEVACQPGFPEWPAGLPGLFISASAVGDFDNDGDLDLLLSGRTIDDLTLTRLYRNDGGSNFVDTGLALPPVEFGALAWGDFNNDGYLDFALAGTDGASNSLARVYRNVGGANFVDIAATLAPVVFSTVTWADFNNDGYLDLLLTGRDDNLDAVAKLYRNTGGSGFVEVATGIAGLTDGATAWGDYDKDGDLDVIVLGVNTNLDALTRIYRNDGGTNFVDVAAGLPGLFLGSAAWGDYENDGDLDLLLTGFDDNFEPVASFLRNDSGSFVSMGTILPGVGFSSAAWGDFDNDGYLDLALAGEDITFTPISRIFHNNAGAGFSDAGVTLPGAALGTLAVGDFNGDSALDLLLGGDGYDTNYFTRIFRNDCAATNLPPSAPGSLQVVVNGSTATFSWAAASDNFTPAAGLSYNLVVGSSPAAVDLNSPMSAVPGGFRRVVRLGAQNQNTSWKLNNLPPGILFWSVQAIDTAFAGGPFAAPQAVEIPLAQLAGVFLSTSAVGDYDNDGDLDILLSGRTGAGETITRLYNNDGIGNFTDAGLSLPQVESGALAFGDFNNDGWLDFVLTGVDAQTNLHAQVFRNNGNGTFTDINVGLLGVVFSTATWADYNNDGYLDLLVTGYNGDNGGAVAKLYRNTGGTGFVEVASGFTGVTDGAAAWGDYDNDGDLDLLLTGANNLFEPITRLYRNDGGTNFVNSGTGLPGTFLGAAAFGDYNNDGRLDVLLTGFDDTLEPRAWVFRNAGGGVFIDALAGLPGVGFSSAAWGDLDNDGFLDLALAGEDLTFTPISRIFRNNGGAGFLDIPVGLMGAASGTLAFGDFNGDSRLDLLLGGDDYASNIVTSVYRNDIPSTNVPPTAPGNLQVVVNGGGMATFSWSAATDDHTPVSGLSYNLVVGSSSNALDVNSPMAAVPGGYRRVVRLGAQNGNLSWKLNDLPGGTLYWSVQAIDSAFAGGPFPAPQSFEVECRPTFPELALGLPGLFTSASAVGDYDNDGDLDFLVSGQDIDGNVITRLYRNEAGTNFVDAGLALPQVQFGSLAFGDFNNDGFLDFVLTGHDGNTNSYARVYRNIGGATFVDVNAPLTAVVFSTATWADYNNDGFLDLLITGQDDNLDAVARLYRNVGGVSFVPVTSGIGAVTDGAAAWGDYDRDGDLDLVLLGVNDNVDAVSAIYRNDGGTNFVDIGASLPALFVGSAAWGDYDNDGDLDLLLTGLDDNFDQVTRVFRNDGGSFVNAPTSLPDLGFSSAAWGDFDNDGYLDVALAGEDVTFTPVSRIFHNNAGAGFSDTGVVLPGAAIGTLAVADFNGDGAIDLLLAGDDYDTNYLTKVFLNDCAATNLPPAAPGNLQVVVNGGMATFSWAAATDDHTPASGLSYNLVVGSSSNAVNVNSPMAEVPGGFRRVVRLGAQNGNLSWKLNDLPAGTLYWSVQAIDTAFAGGPFAAAQAAEIPCRLTFPPLAELAGVFTSASAPGDYDNDGDLDILLSGRTGAGEIITRLYQNNGSGTFVDTATVLPQVESGALAWGDFNNDGFLDFALTGVDSQTNLHARVFRNNGNGTFTDLNAGLMPVQFGTATWADFNNDGFADLLLTGYSSDSGTAAAKLYRNSDGTGFVEVPSGLTAVTDGAAAWGDYDNDGDLDLLLTGVDSAFEPITRLYRNDGGSFVNSGVAFPGVFLGAAAFGDYNNDGSLDIVITGFDFNFDPQSWVLRNAGGGAFINALAGLPGVGFSSAAWGDFDNDGFLDLALAGEDLALNTISRVYRNTGGSGFADTGAVLPGAALGTLAVGDFNGDTLLDLLLGGDDYESNIVTRVYANDCAPTNTPPTAPGNLQVAVNGNLATFSWAAATDDHTPAAGLSYNLVVGTSPALVDVNSPLSAVPGGFRRVVQLGAQNENLSWKLNDLPAGTLYWSVQAIDGAFAGGAFAPAQQVVISTCQPVILAALTNLVRAVGESATFTATASGTAPISYQWSLNGTPLAGETNSSLTVPSAMLASAGVYCVEAANACGRATNCAVLAIFDPFDACLISHWKFDEASGNTAVDSADGNNGTLVNGPIRTGGLFAGALLFDGYNDHVNVPDSRSLALTNRFTISLWFKPSRFINEASGRHDIFQKYASYWLSLNKLGEDGKLVFALNYTGPSVRSQRNSWNSNEWYHAAAVLDGTNMNLYVNGVLEGSIPTTETPLNNSYPVQIGGDTENLTFFPGTIDDVRLYGCALPASQIASIANSAGGAAGPFISTIPDQTTPPNTPTAPIPFTIGDAATPAGALTLIGTSSDPLLVPDANIVFGGGGSNRTVVITPAANRTGNALITITVVNSNGVSASETFLLTVADPLDACLISHWKFDETSGSTAADSVDGNPGTLFNGATNVPGRFGSAVRFDGVNDYVNVADANNLDLTPSFTIGLWLNPSRIIGPGSGRKDVLKKYLAYWLMFNYPANDGRVTFVLNDGQPFVQSTTATWVSNQWYHVTATYDGAVLKLYVNGVLEATKAATALPNKNAFPLQFGGNTDQRLWFAGALDDIRFYGCALTDAQVAELAGVPASPANRAPVISNLGDQLITKNNATPDLPFTVGDPDTNAASLIVSGSSSSQTLVPDANITFGGSGSNRTVKVTPAPNQSGTAIITVRVSDGALTNSDTFVVNVIDSTAADPALISHWKLDETFGILALDATGRNTGALLNQALRTPSGQFGGAVAFDGINQHLNVADSSSLDLSNKFTLSLWFKPSQLLNGASGRKDLLQKFTSYWLILNYPANDGKLEFILNTGSPRVASTTTSWHSNQWYHAAATYDGATMRLYINGVLEGSTATTAIPNITTHPVQIGGNTMQGYWFPGCIDDVRIYGTALNATDVLALLTPPAFAPAAGRPALQLVMQSGRAHLKWNAEAGRAYQLQFKDNFSDEWSDIGQPVTSVTAQAATTDNSPVVPQRFYRLVVLP